ncbi:MAG TPA: 3-phosphoshikimate 1-carboxyvinyltransferase [Gemmatimonadaceae bacterium]|nr:3-phosphoshikimate 1-carboxyvinyltransferase [Gemmatimonadaceae bacterium]
MRVEGTLRVPGDKSISHRALILAALSEGSTRVEGILESADVHSTARVLRALGVDVPALSSDFVIRGAGVRGLRAPAEPLDCGNSGTTTRLMAGVVAALPFTAEFVGDASLSRRPMKRIARPLEAMGAVVELPAHGGLPMTVRGGDLHDLHWHSEIASAQVKSALLLAGVASGVRVEYEEPARSRDHTERMLAARGVSVETRGTHVILPAGARRLQATPTAVPGDPSSAAFFAGLAALADVGTLVLEDVCVNETRTGFLEVLRRMGAHVEFDRTVSAGGEWVSPVVVSPHPLRGVSVGQAEVPGMIDELPLLACIATRAEGETVITGAAELRVKESDRIATVVGNLRALGADADELPDGMRVRGSAARLHGRVQTHGDHRIGMAFGVLGAVRGNDITVDDPGCVAVSYPTFWTDLVRVVRP